MADTYKPGQAQKVRARKTEGSDSQTAILETPYYLMLKVLSAFCTQWLLGGAVPALIGSSVLGWKDSKNDCMCVLLP